jgi:hypothetical protein
LFQLPTKEYRAEAGADEGAVRMLTQLHLTFDVVRPETDWSSFELLILPDAIPVDEAMAEKLRAYVKAGGKLLASGTSGLNAEGTAVVLPELGIEAHGMSPFTAQYLRFAEGFNQDVPPTDHVMYDRAVQVKPAGDGCVAVENVQPYFERAWDHFSSHSQTPPDKVSPYVGAVVTRNTAYIAAPIFGAYIRHGNKPYRLLVRNILEQLLPDRLVRLPNAPLSLEVSVMRQKDRTIIHLLNYTAERRTAQLDVIEDIPVFQNLQISFRQAEAPVKLYLAPEKTELTGNFSKGRLDFVLNRLEGHAMIVIE